MSADLDAAIVGTGPAALIAADILSEAGARIALFERMPSPGRKLLMAGKSGLNLTKAEPAPSVLAAYSDAAPHLAAALSDFGPPEIVALADGLGIETFTGTSARVFPRVMKASPLLRAWLGRLAGRGVALHTRHHWQGWDETGRLIFATPSGPVAVSARTTLLALGGASWPQLGTSGDWAPVLEAAGVEVTPFRPANMGFDLAWPAGIGTRFAGEPLKPVRLMAGDLARRGECVVTATGLEGSVVYAVSRRLREALLQGVADPLAIDLVPDRDVDRLAADLTRQKPSLSLANRLRRAARLSGARAAIALALVPQDVRADPVRLAMALKRLSLPVTAPRPLAEAISSAGGVAWSGIGPDYQLLARPGVFVAGEMIDWEAPTGGYLITAALATGRAAALGMGRALSLTT